MSSKYFVESVVKHSKGQELLKCEYTLGIEPQHDLKKDKMRMHPTVSCTSSSKPIATCTCTPRCPMIVNDAYCDAKKRVKELAIHFPCTDLPLRELSTWY